jgi:hypothetical protein
MISFDSSLINRVRQGTCRATEGRLCLASHPLVQMTGRNSQNSDEFFSSSRPDGSSAIAASRDPDHGPQSAITPEGAKSAFRALNRFLQAAAGFSGPPPVFHGPSAE